MSKLPPLFLPPPSPPSRHRQLGSIGTSFIDPHGSIQSLPQLGGGGMGKGKVEEGKHEPGLKSSSAEASSSTVYSSCPVLGWYLKGLHWVGMGVGG